MAEPLGWDDRHGTRSEVLAPPVPQSCDLSRYEKSIDEIVDAGIADETRTRCGKVAIAGTTASASFVGAIAGALGVADLLRSLHPARDFDVVDVDLRSALTDGAKSVGPRPHTFIAYASREVDSAIQAGE